LKKINKFDQFGDHFFADLMTQPPLFNIQTTIQNMNEKYLRDLIKDNSKDLYNSIKKGDIEFDSFIDEILNLQNKLLEKNIYSTSLSELPDDLDEIYNENNYLPFGIKILDDKLFGLFNSNLICIAGQPGSGKTSFALQIVFPYDSLFVSLEMPVDEVYSKILSRLCEIPSIKIETKNLEDYEFKKIMETHLEIKKRNFHIMTGPAHFYKLYNNIKYKVKTYNLKSVVVDYIQLCQIAKLDKNSELEIITENLKNLAKELNIPILIISQMTKESYKNFVSPTLADLRGSGSIAQNSDVVFFLWKDENKKFQFTVGKGRKYKVGNIENLIFNGKYSRFEETFI
jgi:replicative DNA helicase